MDPLAVLRTIWHHRWLALPAIVLTVAAAAFFYFAGPRTFESSMAYAIANPRVPTDAEIAADPSLLDLNSDNPYLRSTDPNLIADVLITKLNSPETAERLAKRGISTEYTASPGIGGGGLVVTLTASGATPAQSVEVVTELGSVLTNDLDEVQRINGADDRYLFTAIVISGPTEPTEKISSRLRSVIIIGVAGVLLVFGAVSLGTWRDNTRRKRAENEADSDDGDHGSSAPGATTPAPSDLVES